MVELVKKSVAIGIAGVAAVVVAAWRQVQRDNTLATDGASDPGASWEPTPSPATDGPQVDESSSKADLYEVAQVLDIEGRSKMTKTELLDAIRRAS